MSVQSCLPACMLLISCLQAQEWTEARVLERFLEQSPQARELRARVAGVRADAEGRTLYPNPNAVVSGEGAGFTLFFQADQRLPISGRRGLLRQAGAAAVSVAESDSAQVLWRLRSNLRLAFYRMLAAQQKESVLNDGMGELEPVLRVLRAREQEGESSQFDRLRLEREIAERRSQVAAAQAEIAQARATLHGFLPFGTEIAGIQGQLSIPPFVATRQELAARALAHRADYQVEQRQMERFLLERKAAERLRYPEPTVVAGLKRADAGLPRPETGVALGFSVPIPLFNRGHTEVARWQAEIEQAAARKDALERQIRAEVESASGSLLLRQRALEDYRREVSRIGSELSRIARIAYDEGEVGILELLDSYRVNRQALVRLVELEASVKESQIELDRAVGEEVVP